MKSSSKKTFVSVIVPAHNRAHTLKPTIASILAQSYRYFELIIVDDRSTDSTESTVKAFGDKRIIYCKNRGKKGPGAARNTGIRLSGGEYIAYCDSDDIWKSDHLMVCVKYLDSHPETALVSSRHKFIIANNHSLWAKVFDPDRLYPVLPSPELDMYDIFSTSNTVHRRECFKKSGMFSESKEFFDYLGEDWDLWLRIADHFRYKVINRLTAECTLHDHNIKYGRNFSDSHYIVTKKRLKYYASTGKAEQYLFSYFLYKIMLFISDKRYELLLNIGRYVKDYEPYPVFSETAAAYYRIIKGDFRKAMPLIEHVLFLLKRHYRSRSIASQFTKEIRLKAALVYIRSNRFHKAVSLLRYLLRSGYNPTETKSLLAQAYFAAGEIDKAVKTASECGYKTAQNVLALCHIKKGHPHKAEKVLKRIVREHPDYKPAIINLSRICSEKQD